MKFPNNILRNPRPFQPIFLFSCCQSALKSCFFPLISAFCFRGRDDIHTDTPLPLGIMKAITWQAFDLSMDMYSYAIFPRRPCLAFLDTTIHCMRVFVWLQMGVCSGVLQLVYFSACSFFGGNTRGTRNGRSGNTGKRIGFGIILSRNGYYLSP